MARKDDELLQTGRRPKPKGEGTPKIIWAALLVCLVGAALLFRAPSGEAPTGIGENRTVVTAPEDSVTSEADSLTAAAGGSGEPRSGEVDLDRLIAELQPEAPDRKEPPVTAVSDTKTEAPTEPAKSPTTGAQVTTPPATPARTETKPPAQTKPEPRPAEPAAETPSKPVAMVYPLPSGPYLVQAGSFGSPENADAEAGRLKSLGWDAMVKVSNMADNSIVYRVRIGYFATRTEAETFIRQNSKKLPGAIPVHR